MKRVFVSHPFRENEEENFKKVSEICLRITEKYKDVVPVSPIHAFGFLDDNKHREMALRFCRSLMEGCHEVWFFGNWRFSEGCTLELGWSMELNRPARFYASGNDL